MVAGLEGCCGGDKLEASKLLAAAAALLLQCVVTKKELGIYCYDNLPDSFGWCRAPDNSSGVMHH